MTDQKIIVFCGKKQSGKTTAANFVAGYTMTQLGRAGFNYLPRHFDIDDNGNLIVSTAITDIDGNTIFDYGILDLNRKDHDFVRWAHDCLWPYVKIYAYADALKLIANLIFDVPYEWLNGTNEDKKKRTNVKWKNMCAFLSPKKIKEIKDSEKYNKKMTVRELLQYFGTNICRKIYPDCWVDACFKEILFDQPNLAIISDCRFKNEVQAAKKHGAKIVKLERSPYFDIHDSECEVPKMNNSNFDLIIPKDVTIREQNQIILDNMYKWGWFNTHIDIENNEQ